jgi:hypothetical protein
MRHTLIWSSVFTALLMFGACRHADPEQSRLSALSQVRGMPSALPGLSVERAVDQVVRDMQGQVRVQPGRWYCNRAIEHDDEVYKVGYEFVQNGKTARFGWAFHAGDEKLEPLTDYARQVTP